MTARDGGTPEKSRLLFPFPDRELARRELENDPCRKKIPEREREAVVERAWQKGHSAAEALLREQGDADFFRIARESGLTVTERDADCVRGGRRFFAEFLPGRKEIVLYRRSASLWAEANGLTVGQARNLLLAHEYFHFLETNGLGRTSKDHTVPMLRIGKLSFGKTGIRALSEIASHAFAKTVYEYTRKNDDKQ